MPRMRDSQIMFRVFDREVGEMVDQNMHVFGESFAFGRVESWIKNHRDAKNGKTILERLNDMVLMQFTGLHDHTNWDELTDKEKDQWYNREEDWQGKPIYEGDIVQTSEGQIELIKWDDNKRYAAFYPFMPVFSTYLDNTEVIGNKFEDPELMEKVN